MPAKDAIVIGAGVGGLALAIRLRAAGFSVRIFEQAAYPGGKLCEKKQDGYRFDAGPSLFTMPELLDELFSLHGKDPRAYYTYTQLSEICRYFYEDGTRLSSYSDPERRAREWEEKLGIPPEETRRHLQRAADIWELTSDVFIFNRFGHAGSFTRKAFLKGLINIRKMHVFRSMHALNSRYLSDPRAVQLFNRYATYNGSNPYAAPATLHVIPHIEYNLGAYLPAGGMISITRALEKLALDSGVQILYDHPVERILTEDDTVMGIQSKGEGHAAGLVVSNADAAFTYGRLLGDADSEARILEQERSTSAIVFNWGIRSHFEELGLHNIFFSAGYEQEFSCLFDKYTLCDDPTVYIFISSKYEPGDAPPGCENWFVMVNAPADKGQDWPHLVAHARRAVLAKLQRILGRDIEALIATEDILDPTLIEARTSSVAGSLYGPAGNSRWAAFLRHPNYSKKYRNLYFTGGSVHPGGGIPMVLSSAKITAGLIQKRHA